MPFSALIPLIGLAFSAIGTGVAVYSAIESNNAANQAEDARKKQMQLDVDRRRREAVRQSQLAQGQALNSAAAQGAEQGSAIKGSIAAISGNAAETIKNNNQNEALGNQLYDANGRRAGWEAFSSVGGGLQNIGSLISNNNIKLQKLASQGIKGLFEDPGTTSGAS
jgi:hypothetical protein